MKVDLPSPDDSMIWILEVIFKSPSLVVSTFIFVNFIWAWATFGRDILSFAKAANAHPTMVRGKKSFKINVTWRMTISWVIFYGIASFVTQIWAGSKFSPGQGGGLNELISWSALFGAIAAISCAVLIPHEPVRFGDMGWMPFLPMLGGYLIGAVWAVFAFTIKGGPQPSDWWICPALSAVAVIASVFRMRMKVLESWREQTDR